MVGLIGGMIPPIKKDPMNAANKIKPHQAEMRSNLSRKSARINGSPSISFRRVQACRRQPESLQCDGWHTERAGLFPVSEMRRRGAERMRPSFRSAADSASTA
jgi:hypothetical protein